MPGTRPRAVEAACRVAADASVAEHAGVRICSAGVRPCARARSGVVVRARAHPMCVRAVHTAHGCCRSAPAPPGAPRRGGGWALPARRERPDEALAVVGPPAGCPCDVRGRRGAQKLGVGAGEHFASVCGGERGRCGPMHGTCVMWICAGTHTHTHTSS